jgi:hypothetical protein
MGRRTQTPQEPPGRDSRPGHCPGPHSRPAQETPREPELNVGPALVRTIRHYWPDFTTWLGQLPDPRCQEKTTFDSSFLLLSGLSLFLFKLGSRRQLDYDLPRHNQNLLDNLNRLAGTQQDRLPVNRTVDNYLTSIGPQPVEDFRDKQLRPLIRNKVFDAARLQGYFLMLVDGSDYLTFNQPHCPHCVVQSNGSGSTYKHPVLEAKLLGPASIVASLGTVFLENSDTTESAKDASVEQRKQDCELKALARLNAQVKGRYPQMRICEVGDGLYACGTALALAAANKWAYLFVLKEGRIPSVWEDFQQLLPLVPGNRVEMTTPQGVRKVYRWVNEVSYVDTQKRRWTFTVLQCEESKDGVTTRWVWITDLEVNQQSVVEVADRGGRMRWCEENEGFNTQKNSELKMEHAYSTDESGLKVYYLLLQIAHLILQLLEKGSLLRGLAKEQGKSVLALFGSLKNIARRLRDSFIRIRIAKDAYSVEAAAKIQIRLAKLQDSS